MNTTYVLIGIQQSTSYEDGVDSIILAVSADKAKLDEYGKSLRNTTPNWPPVYIHEGRKYTSVMVIGPVLDLDGSKVVVANTVGTINM